MKQLFTACIHSLAFTCQQTINIYTQATFLYLVFNFTSNFFQVLFFLFRQRQLGWYRVAFRHQCSFLFFRQY